MNFKLLAFLLVNFLLSCKTEPPIVEKSISNPTAIFTTAVRSNPTPLGEWNTYNTADSIVVLQNDSLILPFQNLLDHSFHILQFGAKSYPTFDHYFRKYADANSYTNLQSENLSLLTDSLATQNPTFIVLLDESISNNLAFFNIALTLNKIAEQHQLIVVNFSNTNSLKAFQKDIVLVQLPTKSQLSEAIAAQVLFGGTIAMGTLQDSLSVELPKGAGDFIDQTRLAHAAPESVGIDSERLKKIDAIVESAIRLGAFPGGQVLVTKEGKIVYDKAFGHHSYNEQKAVNSSDLYDLASITKAAATTLAAMKLYDEARLNINASIREYIPGRSSLHYTRIRNLLTHTSGLQPHLPIAKYIFHAKDYGIDCDTFFCTQAFPPYTVKVAEDLYFNENEAAKIWKEIYKIRPSRRRTYRYSDLNFILLQDIIEKQTGQTLDKLMNESFYEPLGLRKLTYNPLEKFSAHQIAPTVVDTSWRHQTLRGSVHDEGAALFGGVAGNAGLFSNAEDLAVLFQMLLNGGNYGGTQFLNPATVDKFTSKYHKVHRGLGFDKPSSRKQRRLPYATSASAATFGHTGFTGTCVWADPEEDLIFILLTNRVHPDKYNKRITKYDIRSKMHQAVYDALGTAKINLE